MSCRRKPRNASLHPLFLGLKHFRITVSYHLLCPDNNGLSYPSGVWRHCSANRGGWEWDNLRPPDWAGSDWCKDPPRCQWSPSCTKKCIYLLCDSEHFKISKVLKCLSTLFILFKHILQTLEVFGRGKTLEICWPYNKSHGVPGGNESWPGPHRDSQVCAEHFPREPNFDMRRLRAVFPCKAGTSPTKIEMRKYLSFYVTALCCLLIWIKHYLLWWTNLSPSGSIHSESYPIHFSLILKLLPLGALFSVPEDLVSGRTTKGSRTNSRKYSRKACSEKEKNPIKVLRRC